MPPVVRITSPLPSVEETAARAGVPAARTQELVALAERLAIRNPLGKARRAGPHKAAARKKTSYSTKKSTPKKNGRKTPTR